MKFLKLLSLLLLPIISIGVTYGQCDGITYADELAQFEQMLRDGTDPVEVFPLIEAWASSASVMCADSGVEESVEDTDTQEPILSYSSDDLGLQPVIGPVTLPNGLLKMVIQTDGFFISDIETLNGECIKTGFGSLFNLSKGEASGTASALIGSKECEGLISVSNTREPWTIDIYQIPLDRGTPVSRIYTSEEYGLQAVIGLVVFEDGIYRARVTTDAFFIGSIEAIDGTCDAGFGSMFNISRGQATNGAETTLRTESCVGMIITSNTQEPWTLEFEKLG